jgi:hypothetical protein
VTCRAGSDGVGGSTGALRTVAQMSFVVVGSCMIAAVWLVIWSLHLLELRGPFILGVVLLVSFAAIPMVVGSFVLISRGGHSLLE